MNGHDSRPPLPDADPDYHRDWVTERPQPMVPEPLDDQAAQRADYQDWEQRATNALQRGLAYLTQAVIAADKRPLLFRAAVAMGKANDQYLTPAQQADKRGALELAEKLWGRT